MANPKIKVKRSSVAGKVPQPTQLERGELAVNSYDGKVYIVRDQFSAGIGTTTHTVNPWDEYTIGNKIAYAGIASAQQFQGNLTGSVNSSGISTFGGNITVSGTVDGRDISSDGAKLDTIESNATADQTASEIRTLVGSASDSNVFTDALKTKLDNIEAGATGDQTSEEIEDIVGAMLTGNTESGITVTYQDSDGTIDFVVASQTDQNFTNADHSKLDGIEAGATADQTDSEIKTAYENNSNTNAFTDALLSKLNGIESGATGDQTSEEIEDIVGAMLTGNTESGITVTYQDSDGTIDFAVATQSDENFTSALLSKLNAIEAGATADQTAAEIRTLVDSASDSNVFTDADHSKLDGIASGATNVTNNNQLANGAGYVTQNTQLSNEQVQDIVGGMVSGNSESGITVTYQDSDGTLDFSVASQTDNNFTNADHSKLDGIEAGATADQTASEILSLLSNQTITTTGDIKVNSISKTVQVGDISGDNYLQLIQVNSNSVRGLTNQHGNASVFENLQGTTNQHIVLGDVNTNSSNTLFGVSVTQSGSTSARLTLSGTGNLNVHNNITLGGTVDGRDIASDGSKLDGIEAGATNVTNNNQLTNGAGYVTANTQLSNEQVQDIVGGMVSGNTESGITVTYQDGDGTLDFSVASQTDNNFTNADHSKLDGIEAGADVTDATNVNAAGAVMNSDSTTASMSFVIDEDNMSSNSSTKVPTQQSVKAYVDSEVSGLVDSAPGALNTLNELAAAINDDASFSTTITNSIATKLPLGGGTMTGNIVMSGSQTVDGRDLSVDGSKLDGIEAGATADQTASEILTLIKTVDGAGSGLDADTLDGVSSGSFIRSDATDTVSGELTFTNDANFTGDVYISDTGSNSSAGPILELYRNSPSAADADYLGQIKFQGENDAGQKVLYSKITGKILDASDGTEDGILEFAFAKNGSNNISGRFRSDSLQLLNGTALHVNGAITCDSTIDGRDVASDGSKLDGIESGATADQTAAEIRTLVGSASDSNVFTDADHSKLDGIESGATADQSASEILTLIKTVDGSGSGLDADLLDGANASVSASNSTIVKRHSSGYIFANFFNTTPNTVSSGVTQICVETGNDGYIRHGTAAAVRTFINVENGATADQSASEILTLIKTVDGSGSGLDADTLDGVQASGLVAVGGDTMTGNLRIDISGNVDGIVGQAYSGYFGLKHSDQSLGSEYMILSQDTHTYISASTGSNVYIRGGGNSQTNEVIISTSGTTIGGNTVFHAGNDGSGSGLDADLLDGQHGSYYLNYNNFSNTPTIPTNNNQLTNGAGYVTANTQLSNEQVQDIVGAMVSSNTESGITVTYQDSDGTLDFSVASQTDQNFTNADHSKLDGIESGATADQTASEILTLIKTVDGAGSGLDADTLDGFSSAKMYREVDSASATVGPGWITVAENSSGRFHGEIFVSDSESGDHSFIRIDWMRSFADSVFTVINSGGHQNRITGIRVLRDTNDTYGNKRLQVYVTVSSNYRVAIKQLQNQSNWSSHSVVTPVVQSSISGYQVDGSSLENLNTYNFAAEQGIQVGSGGMKSGGNVDITGNITVSGTVDGRDLASDGSKLDGIESGATADQTASEILSLLVTVDGSGSGLDADTLDGIGSSAFLRSDASDTMTGTLTIGDGSAQTELHIKKADNNVSDHIQIYNGTTRVGEIGCEDSTWLRINQETNKNIYTPRYIRADNGFFVDGTSKGINGSGNFIGGTIAGASDYSTLLRSNANDTATGQITFSKAIIASHGVTGNVNSSGISTISGFTFPSSDGSEDQALVTDGSGQLSFKTLSGGGGATGAATTLSSGVTTCTAGQT